MSNGPIYPWEIIYQAKTQPVPAKEDIARLEWTIVWTEPVRVKPGLHVSLRPFIASPPTLLAAPGTGNLLWYSPWSFVVNYTTMIGEG